jgi:hypothetical protein
LNVRSAFLLTLPLLAILVPSRARADIFQDAAACFASGGPIGAAGAALSGAQFEDLKNATVFTLTHPTCVARLSTTPVDPVLLGLAGSFSAARESGQLPQLFASEDTCRHMVDGTAKRLVARLLAELVARLPVLSGLAPQLNAIANDEIDLSLRQIPGLEVVLGYIDCACAVTYSGLGVERLKRELETHVRAITGCANLIGGAVEFLVGGVRTLGQYIGLLPCPGKMTAGQYFDAVYRPHVAGLALAPPSLLLHWWNSNSMALYDQCYDYYRSGGAACRMKSSNAHETCREPQNLFWGQVALVQQQAREKAQQELEAHLTSRRPGATASWRNRCKSLVNAETREPCLEKVTDGIAVCATLAEQAAHLKLASEPYDSAGARREYDLALQGQCDQMMEGFTTADERFSKQKNMQITQQAADAWRSILEGFWAPRCSDATCRTEVKNLSGQAAAAMKLLQMGSPDKSSLVVATQILKEKQPQFRKAIASSALRVAVVDAGVSQSSKAFVKELSGLAARWSPKCATLECPRRLQMLADTRRQLLPAAYLSRFPEPRLPVPSALKAFVREQSQSAEKGMKDIVSQSGQQALHEQLRRERRVMADQLLETWCEVKCPALAGRWSHSCGALQASCRSSLADEAEACATQVADARMKKGAVLCLPGARNCRSQTSQESTATCEASVSTAARHFFQNPPQPPAGSLPSQQLPGKP